jgi:Glycosyl transferase family 90
MRQCGHRVRCQGVRHPLFSGRLRHLRVSCCCTAEGCFAVQPGQKRPCLAYRSSNQEVTLRCRRQQPIESAVHPTPQIIDWLREHDDEAHRIALAGQAFAQRHLTRPGRLCYLRKLLHTYASLLRCSHDLLLQLTSRCH